MHVGGVGDVQGPFHAKLGHRATVCFDFIGLESTVFTHEGKNGDVLKMWNVGVARPLRTTFDAARRADKGYCFVFQVAGFDGCGGAKINPSLTQFGVGVDVERSVLERWLGLQAIHGEAGGGP